VKTVSRRDNRRRIVADLIPRDVEQVEKMLVDGVVFEEIELIFRDFEIVDEIEVEEDAPSAETILFLDRSFVRLEPAGRSVVVSM
jgi:hypothetical protein